MEPVNKKKCVVSVDDTEVVRENKLTSQKQDEPEEKKRRTDGSIIDLSAHDVEIFSHDLNSEGIVRTTAFTSKFTDQSIQHIKNRVERDDELKIGFHKKYYIYPAFREALLRILETIDESLSDENNPVRMILIHGVPNIGKTSLARCLSYFLALYAGEKETVDYIELCHSTKVDRKVLTESITTACHHKYVVLDQVNTNTLDCSEMDTCAANRLRVGKGRMPLILFTSGHCAPNEEWQKRQKTGLLCYKIITMQIDVALVSKLRQLMMIPQEDVISNEDLLKVTTCYSHMVECLYYLCNSKADAGKDALLDVIYPEADLMLMQRPSVLHFIWLAWQDLLSKGRLPPLDQFTDDDCELNPHHVEYLGYLISGIKGTRDRGLNASLSFMDITGRQQHERNGYTEFESDSYNYKFLSKKRLHEVLRCVLNKDEDHSPEDKYQKLRAALIQLTKEEDTQYQHLRGDLFELLITTICEKEKEKIGRPVGMMHVPPGLVFTHVVCCETVVTELELCHLPLKYERAKERGMSFWCVLNVNGKRPFKGFDFAYMETQPRPKNPVVEKLQLFQVTVNPEGKTHEAKVIMTDFLDTVIAELVEQNLLKHSDADSVVVPYFVCPSSWRRKMMLPYRNSQRTIEVEIPGFPEEHLHQKVQNMVD